MKIHKVKAKGKTYIYAWRGKNAPRLYSEPGTIQFELDYKKAIADRNRPKTRTFASIIWDYEKSPEFEKNLKERTKRDYTKMLNIIGDKFGTMPLEMFDDNHKPAFRRVIMAWRKQLSEKSLRQTDYAIAVACRMCSWAEQHFFVPYNPFSNIEKLYDSDRAEIVWTIADEDAFLSKAEDRFKLALLLALYSGQRQGDLLRMRFSNDKPTDGLPWYDGTHFHVKQRKNQKGKPKSFVRVPAHPKIKDLLDTLWHENGDGPILLGARGKAWKTGFGSAFSAEKQRLGFHHLHFHDLRGTCVTRLRIAGCSISEIASITGHSEKRAEEILTKNYLGNTAELADRAMARLANQPG
jgi:integrase